MLTTTRLLDFANCLLLNKEHDISKIDLFPSSGERMENQLSRHAEDSSLLACYAMQTGK
jgi:hypothetical protein